MTTSSSRLRVSPAPASRPVLRWFALFSILLGLCIAPLLTASADSHKKEKPYALIFGTVWDPDGRPVYGVRVLIRRADKKKPQWEVYSNHMGEFAQRVPAGKADYVVTADLKGFKSLNGRKLVPGDEATVHVEYDERVDTGLHLK
jgi:Carboxypeptidase regulatory-like domain